MASRNDFSGCSWPALCNSWTWVRLVLPMSRCSTPTYVITRRHWYVVIFTSFPYFFFFFLLYLSFHNLGLTPPGTYNPNACGSDACRGSNSLWARTLDRYTRAGLPECVVSTMSGPPPMTTQDSAHTHTQSQDRN